MEREEDAFRLIWRVRRGARARWLRAGLVAAGLVALVLSRPAAAAAASDGEGMAMALRGNVAAISAQWQDGTTHNGFGFIVGARAKELLIVTADHVVRGNGPNQIASDTQLRFFQLQGRSFPATLLGTRNAELDLAVLAVSMAEDIEWTPQVLGASARLGRGQRVWFVGRGANWYVPTQPGTINGVDELSHSIMVDGLNILVGTSGSPLIADTGIVGMIVADEVGGVSRATTIEAIERAMRGWNHAWQMVEAKSVQTAALPPSPPPPPVTALPVEPERSPATVAPAVEPDDTVSAVVPAAGPLPPPARSGWLCEDCSRLTDDDDVVDFMLSGAAGDTLALAVADLGFPQRAKIKTAYASAREAPEGKGGSWWANVPFLVEGAFVVTRIGRLPTGLECREYQYDHNSRANVGVRRRSGSFLIRACQKADGSWGFVL